LNLNLENFDEFDSINNTIEVDHIYGLRRNSNKEELFQKPFIRSNKFKQKKLEDFY
jgi:hypothetical protein